MDTRKGSDETQIKITSGKQIESCWVRFIKFINQKENNITDVKNFMANERTFLNF